MTSAPVDIDDIEATTSEKLLAFVMAAFLLIGTLWFYVRLDDWVRDVVEDPPKTVAERTAFRAEDRAARALTDRTREASEARIGLETDREAYRTELDAGRPAPTLEAKYRDSQRSLTAAERAEAKATTLERSTARTAKPLHKQYDKRLHRVEVKQEWIAGILRFVFVAGWFFASLRLVGRLRRTRSRLLALGFAAVAAGVVNALVFATDYITDYINPLELGPIVLSVVGGVATIGAFVGLQRWLAQRLPGRRVRAGECPFCGHPVRDAGPHCEGCGRTVVDACGACGEPRRVGSAHCPSCGAA